MKEKLKRRDVEGINGGVCLLCNGISCRHCGKDSVKHHKYSKPAIDGLHCDFVTEHILGIKRK